MSAGVRIFVSLTCIYACLLYSCNPQKEEQQSRGEVIYHLFQRSFYDSNGDGHGDLNGLRTQLDYLQELGVTSILMLPLYESIYYHNYFPTDFEKIDPEYGTMEDYLWNTIKGYSGILSIPMEMGILTRVWMDSVSII